MLNPTSAPACARKRPGLRKLYVLLLIAALVSELRMSTQAASAAGRSEAAALADAGQSPRPASTTLRVRGTIEKYDASTGILSLLTTSEKVQFPLAATTRIRRRLDKIDAIELEKLAGYRAAVRYSESSGNKIVESVQVFGKDERTKR